MRAHDIEILAQMVLFKLYQRGLKTRTRAPLQVVRSLFTVEVPELFIEKALENLENTGLIYGSHSMTGASEYEIEAAGIKLVQEALSAKGSAIAQVSELGDEWLLETEETRTAEQSQTIPKFTEFRDTLIIALYEKSNKEGLNVFKLSELADERNIYYRDGWIDEVSNFLNDHGYALVRKSMLGDENAVAKLNGSGLEYAEELIAESGREIADESSTPVPASDRIVTLDDNSAVYKETLSSLEQLTQDASKSNEFANLFANPDDKVRTLSEINSGIQLLKIARVRLTAVYELLVNPLKWITKKLPDAALGALASKVLDGLAKLLGF